MNKTHYEKLIESPLGKPFSEVFRIIKERDQGDCPISEVMLDSILHPKFFANSAGSPLYLHEELFQRKLDLSVFHHAYHIWRDKNYFDLSHRLCQKLKETDLRDLDTFFLRSPYRSLYLSIPKGNGLYIPNDLTGMHEVVGVYLLYDGFDGPQTITLRTEGNQVEGVTKYLNILVAGEDKNVFGDALIFYHLIFWEGKINESLERNKDLLKGLGDPKIWPAIEETFKFLIKVLVYLNCANISIQDVAGLNLDRKVAGLKSSAKKRKFLQRYDKISTKAHKYLDIVVDHNQSSTHSTTCEGSGKILGPKFLERVRGHFKVQHFGTGKSQQKIIWISPYSRGEDAENFREERHYVVK